MKILSEVTSKTGIKGLREDNVLFMISIKLKDICNEYGVFILTATQLNADYTTAQQYDQNLLLDPEIYSNFDYFTADNKLLKEIRKSKFTRLSIHTLVEQLLKYKKPIIASDVEGWQALELIVNSGIEYISSETISPSSPFILPLDKRKVERLTSISKNYQ